MPVSASTIRPPTVDSGAPTSTTSAQPQRAQLEQQHEQDEHERDAARRATSSRRARRADAAWPPISICVPGGSGSSRSDVRAPRPRRRRDRRSASAAVHQRARGAGCRGAAPPATAADRTSTTAPSGSRDGPYAIGDARERLGAEADRVGIAQPNADRALRQEDLRDLAAGRSRSSRSAPTVAGVETEPRELRRLDRASAGSGVRPSRPSNTSTSSGRLLERLADLLRPALERARVVAEDARPRSAPGCRRGRRARPAAPATYSKRASGTRVVQLARGRGRSRRRCVAASRAARARP